MYARVTKSFRVAEGNATRKYTPGDVAKGRSAKLAVDNGWGEKISEKAALPPENKVAAPAKNKAAAAAPENKSG